MSNFESVKVFMRTFGQEIKDKPSFPSAKITQLRYSLIKEELNELKEAIDKNHLKRSCGCFNRYTLCYIWSWACFWD